MGGRLEVSTKHISSQVTASGISTYPRHISKVAFLLVSLTGEHYNARRLISTFQELTELCGPLAPVDQLHRSSQQVLVTDHWCWATAIRIDRLFPSHSPKISLI